MTSVIKGDSNVNLDFSTGGRITGDFSNGTIANRVMFQTSTANSATSVSTIPSGTNTQSDFFAFNAADPNNASLLLMRAGAAETTLRSGITGTGSYLPMTFYTGGSERMRIDTSGNVGIGSSATNRLSFTYNGGTGEATIGPNSTGGSTYLTFGTSSSGTYGEKVRIDSSGNLLVGRTTQINQERFGYTTTTDVGAIFQRANDTQFYPAAFYTSNGLIGYIYSSGSSTLYSTSSDYRLKHDIQLMTGALAKVAALKPCTYKWNVDDSTGQGFIAHELAEVCPDAVVGEKDAVNEDGSIKPQGIDTSFLVATLTAAIQELKAIVDAQGAEIAALKGTA